MGGIVLALDVATTTGWAHDGPTVGVPVSGTWRLPSPDQGDRGPTFHVFHTTLVTTLDALPAELDAIVFEAPIPRAGGYRGGADGKAKWSGPSNAQVRLTNGLMAIAELEAARRGAECFEASIMSVKSHFAGHGHATKQMMMMRCRQLGWQFEDDNAADAMAVWAYAKARLDPLWRPAQFHLFYDRPAV